MKDIADNFTHELQRESDISKELKDNQLSVAILRTESIGSNITKKIVSITGPKFPQHITEFAYDERGNVKEGDHLYGELERQRLDAYKVYEVLRGSSTSNQIVETDPFIFGRKEDAKKELDINEALRLISDFWDANEYASEYSNGLCGTFAIAISNLFKDVTFWGIGPSGNPSLHFFAQIGDYYIDSTGVFSTLDEVSEGTDLDDAELEHEYGGEIVKEKVLIPYGQSVCQGTGAHLEEELTEIMSKWETTITSLINFDENLDMQTIIVTNPQP